MADRQNDIRDDEFRVIGHAPKTDPPASDKKRRNLGVAIVSALIVLAIGLLVIQNWPKGDMDDPAEGVFENAPVAAAPVEVKPLGAATDRTFTERLDTVINDVRLSVYIPHNATPVLYVGNPNAEARKGILAFQAADIRRDNRKILGAFVLKGQPLAWGLSKKGYCAIIDGRVTVGVSENSPLFEEATEKEGYFFRQYPLVDNGVLVENEPKNKTMRKALCSRAGQIIVVVSETDESFHDFSQALVDLGVENAIYLVGSHSAFGWWRNETGAVEAFGIDDHRESFKNVSYIIWSNSSL